MPFCALSAWRSRRAVKYRPFGGSTAKPEGFCDSAWDSTSAFVTTLARSGGNFYDGWMKNPKSAMISCNDGFRPVSFYIKALAEDAE